MKYPDRQRLLALGEWAHNQPQLTQAIVDDQTQKLTG
jgi:hypothetical protein